MSTSGKPQSAQCSNENMTVSNNSSLISNAIASIGIHQRHSRLSGGASGEEDDGIFPLFGQGGPHDWLLMNSDQVALNAQLEQCNCLRRLILSI